jgi:hypothetical protein
MRTYALGLAALLGLAIPASADTAANRIQLAQAASDSGAQTGSNAGTVGRGSRESTGARGGDAMQKPGGSAGTRTSEGRRDSEQSRAGVRADVRVGGDRHMTHSRGHGARTAIRTRTSSNDDVVVRRHKARRHVYSEPSSITVKRKRVHRVVDNGDTAVVRHRRPGVAIGVGVSSRTGVRERTGASVNVKGSSTTRSTTTTTSGERSSGSAGARVRTNTSGQGTAGNSSGGAMKSRSTSGSGGAGEPSGNR